MHRGVELESSPHVSVGHVLDSGNYAMWLYYGHRSWDTPSLLGGVFQRKVTCGRSSNDRTFRVRFSRDRMVDCFVDVLSIFVGATCAHCLSCTDTGHGITDGTHSVSDTCGQWALVPLLNMSPGYTKRI
jgi:hypothetical protein